MDRIDPDAVALAGEFERWVDTERAELRSRFMRCADVVVKELLNSHHAKDAVALARRVRSTDPLRQQGWRLLLESLLASGPTSPQYNQPVSESIEIRYGLRFPIT